MTLEAEAPQAETPPAKWSDTLAHDLEPVSVGGFTSQEYYDREIKQMWNRIWIHFCQVRDLPKPGDYVVKTIPWTKSSVVVARGRDGELHAYHNVCSHRCNRLVNETQGNAKNFQCIFHGWVYNLDGSLRAIPDQENYFNLDRSKLGLTKVHVGEWKDFVFINLAPEPPETLEEFLGGYPEMVHDFPFENFTQEFTWTIEVDANWKALRDAFAEAYHVPFQHDKTIGDGWNSKDNPFTHNLHIGTAKYHWMFSTYGNSGMTLNPMEALAMSRVSVGSLLARDVEIQLPTCLNPTRKPNWAGDITQIFPSLEIIVLAGFFIVYNFWPVARDKSIMRASVYHLPPQNATQRWSQQVGATSFFSLIREDVYTAEAVQSTMGSGAKTHIHLADEELCVRHSHYWNQQIVGPYPEAGAP